MKASNFWFGFSLGATIMLIPFMFYVAQTTRGYAAIGGEVFTIALPVIILWLRAEQVKHVKQHLREKQLKTDTRSQHTAVALSAVGSGQKTDRQTKTETR